MTNITEAQRMRKQFKTGIGLNVYATHIFPWHRPAFTMSIILNISVITFS